MNNVYTYSLKDVADMLHVRRAWVKNEIKAGRMRGFLIGNVYRVPHGSLEEWEQRRHEAMIDSHRNKRGIFGRVIKKDLVAA